MSSIETRQYPPADVISGSSMRQSAYRPPIPLAAILLLLGSVFLGGCQPAPQVQIEQRDSSLSRGLLQKGRVAVLAVVPDAGKLPPGLEPVAIGALRSNALAGEVIDPAKVSFELDTAKDPLASAVEQFQRRNAIDTDSLRIVGQQANQKLGADYLALVKLSQLSGYFDPSAGHSRMSREGTGASATARLALVDCRTGQLAFMAVAVAHREGGSYAREAPPPPVSYGGASRASETQREAVYSDDATPAAAVAAALQAILQQI